MVKRYDAWTEPEEAQRGYTTGSSRVDLLEKTMGKYVTFDDYDKEVSVLRAELARVKAESLRVVADGKACDWEMLEDSDKDGLFVVDGKLYCRDRGTRNKIVDVSTGEAIHIYDEDGVQPVRLERWEDE